MNGKEGSILAHEREGEKKRKGPNSCQSVSVFTSFSKRRKAARMARESASAVIGGEVNKKKRETKASKESQKKIYGGGNIGVEIIYNL